MDEYLSTTYKPACDYLEGVLRVKPLPTSNLLSRAWVTYRLRDGLV